MVAEIDRAARTYDLDLRAVRCLVVLAEERHYGRACARLHLSQSGLSRAILILERRIGERLVTRSSRPISLSPAGEILVLHGRRLLEEQEATFARLAATTDAAGPS
jgi:DNA-binding transcriptional LysR family regulator